MIFANNDEIKVAGGPEQILEEGYRTIFAILNAVKFMCGETAMKEFANDAIEEALENNLSMEEIMKANMKFEKEEKEQPKEEPKTKETKKSKLKERRDFINGINSNASRRN